MKASGLPRQTKPPAGIPEKKTSTRNLKTTSKTTSNANPKKHSQQRRKKASGKSRQRRGHPYDDAFRTLLKTCSPLILPVINEMFGEHYTGKELIEFHSEQHRLNGQNGKGEWRITDSTFTVTGNVTETVAEIVKETATDTATGALKGTAAETAAEAAAEAIIETISKHYLLEVQSTADNSMLVRIFEYSTQTALAAAELTRDSLHVTIPHSGILFLRSTGKTPDRMQIQIDTPGGAVAFDVPVLKTKEYTIDEIFEKNLLMLIPFYIFTHESRFPEYNTNDEKLRKLKTEYRDIIERLKELKKSNQLTEYQYHMLIDMSRNVLDYIASRYDRVRKGVGEFMGGRIIETEASRIYYEGELNGEKRGEMRGEMRGEKRGEKRGELRKSEQTAIRLYNMGDGYERIATALDVDVRQVQMWIRKSSKANL